ncbi:uncharacterized protein BJ171DRAFT_278628 [Polychytrium aggregatum]|uniref:uncharacterized protein n=1 Tax=Polychytrium aggregatum TaxID=110093 RepID=UPI0022FE0EF0|nr:uncharacterized protein BJ171DRAFT_278628 [Polychytrium aggregatum]KAI9207630.1 hypothetical protein BJ171DRAFT_278628 [Polychytrium aggregatum]
MTTMPLPGSQSQDIPNKSTRDPSIRESASAMKAEDGAEAQVGADAQEATTLIEDLAEPLAESAEPQRVKSKQGQSKKRLAEPVDRKAHKGSAAKIIVGGSISGFIKPSPRSSVSTQGHQEADKKGNVIYVSGPSELESPIHLWSPQDSVNNSSPVSPSVSRKAVSAKPSTESLQSTTSTEASAAKSVGNDETHRAENPELKWLLEQRLREEDARKKKEAEELRKREEHKRREEELRLMREEELKKKSEEQKRKAERELRRKELEKKRDEEREKARLEKERRREEERKKDEERKRLELQKRAQKKAAEEQQKAEELRKAEEQRTKELQAAKERQQPQQQPCQQTPLSPSSPSSPITNSQEPAEIVAPTSPITTPSSKQPDTLAAAIPPPLSKGSGDEAAQSAENAPAAPPSDTLLPLPIAAAADSSLPSSVPATPIPPVVPAPSPKSLAHSQPTPQQSPLPTKSTAAAQPAKSSRTNTRKAQRKQQSHVGAYHHHHHHQQQQQHPFEFQKPFQILDLTDILQFEDLVQDDHAAHLEIMKLLKAYCRSWTKYKALFSSRSARHTKKQVPIYTEAMTTLKKINDHLCYALTELAESPSSMGFRLTTDLLAAAETLRVFFEGSMCHRDLGSEEAASYFTRIEELTQVVIDQYDTHYSTPPAPSELLKGRTGDTKPTAAATPAKADDPVRPVPGTNAPIRSAQPAIATTDPTANAVAWNGLLDHLNEVVANGGLAKDKAQLMSEAIISTSNAINQGLLKSVQNHSLALEPSPLMLPQRASQQLDSIFTLGDKPVKPVSPVDPDEEIIDYDGDENYVDEDDAGDGALDVNLTFDIPPGIFEKALEHVHKGEPAIAPVLSSVQLANVASRKAANGVGLYTFRNKRHPRKRERGHLAKPSPQLSSAILTTMADHASTSARIGGEASNGFGEQTVSSPAVLELDTEPADGQSAVYADSTSVVMEPASLKQQGDSDPIADDSSESATSDRASSNQMYDVHDQVQSLQRQLETQRRRELELRTSLAEVVVRNQKWEKDVASAFGNRRRIRKTLRRVLDPRHITLFGHGFDSYTSEAFEREYQDADDSDDAYPDDGECCWNASLPAHDSSDSDLPDLEDISSQDLDYCDANSFGSRELSDDSDLPDLEDFTDCESDQSTPDHRRFPAALTNGIHAHHDYDADSDDRFHEATGFGECSCCLECGGYRITNPGSDADSNGEEIQQITLAASE